MLGVLIGATLFLAETIFVKWLRLRKSYMMIISLAVLFIQIQHVPSIAEGFFWFNGSSYYTLFFAFAMILAALLFRIVLAQGRLERNALTIIAALLAFIIGGGNLSTGLFTVCALFVVLMIMFSKKHPQSRYIFTVFVALLVAFAINVLAPGNAVRAAATEQMNPIAAIIKSIYRALTFVGNWTTLSEIAVLIFVSPLLYIAAQRCSWTFKYPFLVIALVFGLYACQITPPLYAISKVGGGRQINIYYYSLILMLVFDAFYICGWIAKKHCNALAIFHVKQLIGKNVIAIILVLAAVFAAGCFPHGIRNMSTVACTVALLDGSAREYDKVVSANVKEMEAVEGDCYIQEVSNCPPIFQSLGLSEDNTYWVNQQYAEYYDCESVNLIVEE